MIEFTGERVVPGQVDDDLWAEHISRYEFSARLLAASVPATGTVLDVGCGTGYGAGLLAHHVPHVVGVDLAHDALAHAAQEFRLPNLALVQASAAALPFRDQSFAALTAFEVIEHLDHWRNLISEARRVLKPGGLFLVSTPNQAYYTESRGEHGANPYHVHEFDFDEFRSALAEFFPHTRILLQNHLGAIAFHPHGTFPPFDHQFQVHADRSRGGPETAHYFLALCSDQPLPDPRGFLYIPTAANVLRERELHIRKLEQQLAEMTTSRAALFAAHQELNRIHDQQTAHLEQQNQWAQSLDQDLTAAREKIAALYQQLQADRDEATRKLQAAIQQIDTTEQELIERTKWAQQLDEQVRQLEARWNLVRSSRWIGLGRQLGLGPNLESPSPSHPSLDKGQ